MNKIKLSWGRLKELVLLFREDNTGLYASQASFFISLSSIPFLMLVFVVAGSFIDVDPSSVISIISSFAPEGISEMAAKIIGELFGRAANVPVISLTAVSALWLASRGIMALTAGLDNIGRFPRAPYIRARLKSLFFTSVFIIALALTFVFIAFGGAAERTFEVLKFMSKGKIVLVFVYLTLAFVLMYKFLPQKHAKFTETLPGAAAAAFMWLVFSLAYSFYIDNFANYTLVYGSLTAVALLMLLLYFFMNIFLFGAQLNKYAKKYIKIVK